MKKEPLHYYGELRASCDHVEIAFSARLVIVWLTKVMANRIVWKLAKALRPDLGRAELLAMLYDWNSELSAVRKLEIWVCEEDTTTLEKARGFPATNFVEARFVLPAHGSPSYTLNWQEVVDREVGIVGIQRRPRLEYWLLRSPVINLRSIIRLGGDGRTIELRDGVAGTFKVMKACRKIRFP